MDSSPGHYEEYLRIYYDFMKGGHYDEAHDMLWNAQGNSSLTNNQAADLLALQGVCSSLLNRHDEAHTSFDTALYSRLASEEPTPALARQCLDYGIFFLNQETVWLTRACSEIERAVAYCDELYEASHPVRVITNGFRGYALHQLGDSQGSVIMQDALARLLGQNVPVDETSLAYHVWMDGTNWLYDCRALIPGYDKNTPYIAIVPKGFMLTLRRFTVAAST